VGGTPPATARGDTTEEGTEEEGAAMISPRDKVRDIRRVGAECCDDGMETEPTEV